MTRPRGPPPWRVPVPARRDRIWRPTSDRRAGSKPVGEIVNLELVTGPATEPVSLTEAKVHCRVDGSDEDAAIGLLITQAREWVERFTRRALITQTWRGWLPAFPDGLSRWGYAIEIPKGVVTSIASVKYLDTAGDLQTLDAAVYALSGKSPNRFPRVVLAYGQAWPATREDENAVQIEFAAGYADAAAVPASLKQAILLHVGWHYEHREMETGSSDEGLWGQMERALERKLADWRIFTFE